MTSYAQFILLAWIPICLYLFSRFSSQRAVIIGFIAAWLFLPQGRAFTFQGLPEYDKVTAICYGIVLGVLIFDFKRVTSFRWSWLDLPMVVWCVVPVVSSLVNGLGLKPGLSWVYSISTIRFAIPYFLGRLYLNNLAGLRRLAMGILIGGLIYLPLCLYEIRMSPLLHKMVYGYLAAPVYQQIRWGGYRPTVFMRHGLSVGMWMMAATLIGVWLWQTRAFKKFWEIPASWLVLGLLITFALLRSFAAYSHLMMGIVILYVAKWFRQSLPLLLLILGIWFYLFLGVSGILSAENVDQIVKVTSEVTGSQRAGSLKVRLDNEQILGERGRQKMILGWGPGESNIYVEKGGEGQQTTVTDSLWIIAFGQFGVVGLVSIFGALLLPAVGFFLRYPARSWFTSQVAPAAALSVIITSFAVDCTLNAQNNPIYWLAAGGIASLVLKPKESGNNQQTGDPSLRTKYLLLQARRKQRRLVTSKLSKN